MHLNYIFAMTARDVARFGSLCLRKGLWRDSQMIRADWVARGITSYSQLDS